MQSAPTMFAYKIVLVLFVALFYLKDALDYDLAGLLEAIMFLMLAAAVLVDIVLWVKRIKKRVETFRAKRIGDHPP